LTGVQREAKAFRMFRVSLLSLMMAVAMLPAAADTSKPRTIDFPCFKNLSDGRVLVDGTQWDEKMRRLGYVLEDGAFVPYEVLSFTQQTTHDQIWADGMCRMKLLPVAK
jgi:hypothetical protein